MIQTYFGDGKGKTTAAIGAAVRCAGCGEKVLFVQFLKNNDSSEFGVLLSVKNIDVLYSDKRYELYDNLSAEHSSEFITAYNKLLFEDVVNLMNNYRMIILDEIIDAVEFGYIDENKFLSFLSNQKNRIEIILTGHSLSNNVLNISDYVSEIKSVKHPYTEGVLPRKGIEY